MRHVLPTLVLLLFAAGCSNADRSASSERRIVLDLWVYWAGFEKDALDDAVDAFNASQDEILVQTLNIVDPETKVMLATAGGHPPDLALLPYFSIAAFAENNALTPLNGLAERHDIAKDDFLPIFWEGCSYRGFLWGMPITASVTALHYNKGVFRDAGLDPAHAPQTLAELERMNEQIAARREDGSLQRIGHHPTQPGWWQTSWPRWFGGRVWDGESRMLIDTPQWSAAADWLASYPERFGAADLTRFKSGFGKFASPQNPFFTGKVAMIHQGIWMDNFARKYASEDFQYAIAPFPADGSAAQPFVSIAEPDCIVIPRGVAHPEAAFAFLAFLAQQEVLEPLAIKHKKLTSLRNVSPRFFEQHPHPFIAEFRRIADSPYCVNRAQIPHYDQYQSEITEMISSILQGRATASDALARAQANQQASLEKQLTRWNRVAAARKAEWTETSERLAAVHGLSGTRDY